MLPEPTILQLKILTLIQDIKILQKTRFVFRRANYVQEQRYATTHRWGISGCWNVAPRFSSLQIETDPQIEAIFELGDVDGDGEIDMGEFVGEFLEKLSIVWFKIYLFICLETTKTKMFFIAILSF